MSLDPTHDREQTERYVRVGVGRDYADVPPTRGVYKGKAKEELEVAVRIRELTQAAAIQQVAVVFRALELGRASLPRAMYRSKKSRGRALEMPARCIRRTRCLPRLRTQPSPSDPVSRLVLNGGNDTGECS